MAARAGGRSPRATRAGAARNPDSTQSGGPPGDFRRCRATDETAWGPATGPAPAPRAPAQMPRPAGSGAGERVGVGRGGKEGGVGLQGRLRARARSAAHTVSRLNRGGQHLGAPSAQIACRIALPLDAFEKIKNGTWRGPERRGAKGHEF